METLTRIEQQMATKTVTGVRSGNARVRELTPAQQRAVMFAQQQVLKARAAKKAKDEREAALRSRWSQEGEPMERVGEDDALPLGETGERRSAQPAPKVESMTLHEAIGQTLRDLRVRDHRTLREVSSQAGVSLGYLSEVERSRKDASSDLLVYIEEALGVSAAQLLRLIADRLDA